MPILIGPLTLVNSSVTARVLSFSMFFAIEVMSFILFIVIQGLYTISMLFVFLKLTDITVTISVCHGSVAFFLTVLPLTFVSDTIWPKIVSFTAELIVNEVSFIDFAIILIQGTISMF